MKKVGLFFCRAECIDFESVDVDSLAKEYPDLAAVSVYDNLHRPDSMEDIVSHVREKSLEGIVFAACSSKYFINTFSR